MGAAVFFYNAIDRNGSPVSGAKANFYVKGTTTRQAAYTDSALTTPAANPVVADSAGRVRVYLNDTLNYSLDVKNSDQSETLLQADYTSGDTDPMVITMGNPVSISGLNDAIADAENVVTEAQAAQTAAAASAAAAAASETATDDNAVLTAADAVSTANDRAAIEASANQIDNNDSGVRALLQAPAVPVYEETLTDSDGRTVLDAITDDENQTVAYTTEDGINRSKGIAFGGETQDDSETVWAESIQDVNGDEALRRDHQGRFYIGEARIGRLYVGAEQKLYGNIEPWSAQEAAALTLRQQTLDTSMFGKVQWPSGDWNEIISSGQSNDQSYCCFPVVSTTAVLNVYTLGGSVQGSGADAFNAITDGGLSSGFNHAIARVIDRTTDNTYLDSTEIAALDPDDDDVGEAPVLGFANAFAKGRLGKYAALSVGVGGQGIDVLLNTRFGRFEQGVDDVKTAVDARSNDESLVIFAVPMIHGEKDYNLGTTKATYKTKCGDFFDDQNTYCASNADNVLPPLKMFVSCARAEIIRVSNNVDDGMLAIDMAQAELAFTRDDTILSGVPLYAIPDKDSRNHKPSNSSRWVGECMAKEARRIYDEHKGHINFFPYAITLDENNNTIWFATFMVPKPPIQWLGAYVDHTASIRDDYGFRFRDDAGDVTFTAAIVDDCTIKFELSRALGAGARVLYAGDTVDGVGNLADSDPAISTTNYEFVTDMAAYENITALVNSPYPQNNFCWPFAVTLPFDFPTWKDAL